MSMELQGAILLKLLRCPKCGSSITRTEKYEMNIEGNPQSGYMVTLVCENCGWIERTNNWSQFIVKDETPADRGIKG